jgi:hypothetical protein
MFMGASGPRLNPSGIAGLLLGCLVILLGAANVPPPFTGQAAFSTSWENAFLLATSKREKQVIAESRAEILQDIQNWPDRRIKQALELAARKEPPVASDIALARRALTISVTEPGPEQAVITLKVSANERAAAETFTAAALETARSTIKTSFRLNAAADGYSAAGTAETLNERMQAAASERSRLEMSASHSEENRRRIEELRRIEQESERQRTENGLNLLMQLGTAVYGPELPVVQTPSVTERSLVVHWTIVFSVAAVAGLLCAALVHLGFKISHCLMPRRATPAPLPHSVR